VSTHTSRTLDKHYCPPGHHWYPCTHGAACPQLQQQVCPEHGIAEPLEQGVRDVCAEIDKITTRLKDEPEVETDLFGNVL